MMSTVYLVSHGGKLRRENDTLLYESRDGMRTKFFPHETEQVILIGRVEITGAALELLMKHQIEMVFLSHNGDFNGNLEFQRGPNVFLRKKQYCLVDNKVFCFNFVKSVVKNKLLAQLSFMQRLSRSKMKLEDLKRSIRLMKNLIALTDNAEEIKFLRGLEGKGAAYYFGVFGQNLFPDWANFDGRNKHPPLDPVNAVLSFVYTLILYRVRSACLVEGLDPYCGYFHVLSYGKQTLVFDLMEEFRTDLGDRLVVSMFSKGTLKKEDFRIEEWEDGEESGQQKAVLLTKDGLKKVIHFFEKKLENRHYYLQLQQPVSYKKIIREQVKQMKRVVIGEDDFYQPWRAER